MDKQSLRSIDLNQDCEVCYKIKCKNCGWEPDGKEVQEVLSRKLTNCPECEWNPSE